MSTWGGEFEQGGLLDLIAQADFLVAHNAKYELHWLKRCGQDLRKLFVFDTKIAEYVLLGNLASPGNLDLGVAPRSYEPRHVLPQARPACQRSCCRRDD
jgi:hypothetical protein